MFYLFVKFPILEKLRIRHLPHDIAGCHMQFVLLHDYQIAIWNYLYDFCAGQVKIVHERRNLSQ